MIARVERVLGAYKLVVTIYGPRYPQPKIVELPDIFSETKVIETRVDGNELYILLLEAAMEFNCRMLLRHIIVLNMETLEVIGEHDLELIFQSTGYKNFLESLHVKDGIVGIMDGDNDLIFYNLRNDWQNLKTADGARLVTLSDGMYLVRRSQHQDSKLDFNLLDDSIRETYAFSVVLPSNITMASFIKLNPSEILVIAGMQDASAMTYNHNAWLVNIETQENILIGKIPLKINDPYQSTVSDRAIYILAKDDKSEELGVLIDLNRKAFKPFYYPKLFHETKKLIYYKKFKNLSVSTSILRYIRSYMIEHSES